MKKHKKQKQAIEHLSQKIDFFHAKKIKSKKRSFSFISSFYFISILARLFLLFMMAFIISKIILSTLFPPKNEVYASSYCCEASSTIHTIPADFLVGFSDSGCTYSIVTQYTLPFTIGSTTYYQLPATVGYFRWQAGMCH